MAERKTNLHQAIVVGVILTGIFAFLCPILSIIGAAMGPDGFAGQFIFALGMLFGFLVMLMAIYFLVIISIMLFETRVFSEDQAMVQGKLEKMVERQNTAMENLLNVSLLSDKTKSLLHREHETGALHDAFHSMLMEQDYIGAKDFIEQIDKRLGMPEAAQALRNEIEQAKQSTLDDQIDKAISRVRELLDKFEWARAKREADKLIQNFPDNAKINALTGELETAYNNKKGLLLKEYDRAVQINDIEKSIDLLKELDKYLSPQEAAALTESARDVFKKKLHNLGVQFSIALADGDWNLAVTTGEQIAKEYPNSRMAREVRDKMSLLKQYAATAAQQAQQVASSQLDK